MTVHELIEKLEQFDRSLRVVDDYMLDIEEVKEITWVDTNYPYTKPDEQVVIIQ